MFSRSVQIFLDYCKLLPLPCFPHTSHQKVFGLALPCAERYTAAIMTPRKDNDFLNGVPELLILKLLARQSMYGYEIVQAIRLTSEDVLAFGEGCVYPILHRLEADGCLSSQREQVAGRSRVVYRVTSKGEKRLNATTARWASITAVVARMLEGGRDGSTALA
jgi:PadR family transcriptional regulator PadR